jgi:hypothetical protein
MGFEGDLEGFLRDFVGTQNILEFPETKKEALIRASLYLIS